MIRFLSGPQKKRARTDAGPVGINQDEAEEDNEDDEDYADDEDYDEKRQKPQIIAPTRLGTAPERVKELTRDPFEFSDASRVQDTLKTRNKISLLIGKTVSEKLAASVPLPL